MSEDAVKPLLPAKADSVRIRLVAGRVMNELEHRPVWKGPMGKLAVFAAIESNLAQMLRSGEDDEAVLFETVLAWVSAPAPPTRGRAL